MKFCKILQGHHEIEEATQRLIAQGFKPNAACPPKN